MRSRSSRRGRSEPASAAAYPHEGEHRRRHHHRSRAGDHACRHRDQVDPRRPPHHCARGRNRNREPVASRCLVPGADPRHSRLGGVSARAVRPVAIGQDPALPGGAARTAARPAPANLPVPIEPEIDPKRVEMLDAAVSWVELATRNLIKIWSGRGDETPAFALTWEALERWLAEFVQIAHTPAGRIDSAFRDLLRKLDEDAFAHTPLAQLVKLIRSDEIAIKLFLTVLVADLDIRFHRLFGALHDDLGRRYASIGLACAIIAAATDDATPVTIRAEVAALERLRALGLVHGLGRAVASADEPLRIEPACLDWLLTADPERLIGSDGARLVRPTPENAIALLSATRLRHVRRAVRRSLVGQGDRRAAAVLLTGSVPGWIEAEAGALAGPELRIGPPSADISPDALQSALRSLLVASRITGRRLVVDLMTEGPAADAVWRALAPMLAHFKRRPYLVALNAARLLAMTG